MNGRHDVSKQSSNQAMGPKSEDCGQEEHEFFSSSFTSSDESQPEDWFVLAINIKEQGDKT